MSQAIPAMINSPIKENKIASARAPAIDRIREFDFFAMVYAGTILAIKRATARKMSEALILNPFGSMNKRAVNVPSATTYSASPSTLNLSLSIVLAFGCDNLVMD